MNTFPFPRPVATLLCTVSLLIGAIAGCAYDGQPKQAAKSLSTNPASKFEIDFLKGMIDHHAMATHMGRTCVTRATHAELRAMCEDMKTAQQSEIVTMQGWLKDWYGIAYQPLMKPGEMRQMEGLEGQSGSAFEIAFLEMMSQHHRTAIRKAEECLEHASHAELKQLCQNIHDTQQTEVTQMQRWLCEWYQKCR